MLNMGFEPSIWKALCCLQSYRQTVMTRYENGSWQVLAVILNNCIFNIWYGLIVVAGLWSYCILKIWHSLVQGVVFYCWWLTINWLSSLLHSNWWCHLLCSAQSSNKQDRQCMYNVMLRCICITIIAMEKQCSKYNILWLCVCTLDLVIQHENHIYSVQYYVAICSLFGFCTLSLKRHDFWKILLSMIFSTTFVWKFLILIRI